MWNSIATNHLTHGTPPSYGVEPYKSARTVLVGNGSRLDITNIGTFVNNTHSKYLILQSLLYPLNVTNIIFFYITVHQG